MHTDGGGGGEGREGGRGCGGVGVETILFVSVVSLCIRNTETNRNKTFNGFENEPKQTRNRSCFGYFRFEPKFLFICFVDTLVGRDEVQVMSSRLVVTSAQGINTRPLQLLIIGLIAKQTVLEYLSWDQRFM